MLTRLSILSSPPSRSCPAPARSRAGFTLVEMLVIISILTILVGIGVVAGAKMLSGAKASHTRSILQAAKSASTEYEAQTRETINHDGSYPIDWDNESGDLNLSIERFVFAAREVPEAAQILQTLGDAIRDTDGDGHDEIVDGWDRPIVYARQSAGGTLPAHPRPFFASGGPDGEISTQDDNLYSYEVE